MANRWLAKLKARHLTGVCPGLFSICSAHPVVLASAMETLRHADQYLLVEATANQVNQFGGYTGLTPVDFVHRLHRLARDEGVPVERLLVGADHLGPHIWRGMPAKEAMPLTEALVRQCVSAGFVKIHLDTSAGCISDPGPELPLELSAERAAGLCAAAEAEAKQSGTPHRPFYVIGNETPLPGGDLKETGPLRTTDPHHVAQAVDAFQHAFHERGLHEAWERILAVVVQPGVEFGDRRVAVYRPERAATLSAAHGRLPGGMTYEVHATDYQPAEALKRLVGDHFALLKVGPCLTFAMRSTLYALSNIEAALPTVADPVRLPEVMERLMTAHPVHWQSHLQGSEDELYDLRHQSLRDRIRYYWSFPEAREAVAKLFRNLSAPIPESLLNEHLPDLYPDIVRKELHADPEAIVRLGVAKALEAYTQACWPQETIQ